MSSFRGSDDALEREIRTLETIARLRVRRAAADLRTLDRDLRELRRERARRQARADENVSVPATAGETAAP